MASSLRSTAFLLAAFTPLALSHGMVTTFKTDGVQHQGFILDYYYNRVNKMPVPDIAAWYAENLDSGFVAPNSYGSPDIICHKNARPGTLTTSVAAGGTVSFQWPATWPHPYGPMLTYVAKCAGDCTKADKSALKWVKIQEAGYANGKWASADMVAKGGVWTATVPKSLASGNYVFRHETIALHGAGTLNGAQNYPQCFNINITGGGSANPEGVLGTALYKATDPGIYMNPYGTITDYKIPGPPLFKD